MSVHSTTMGISFPNCKVLFSQVAQQTVILLREEPSLTQGKYTTNQDAGRFSETRTIAEQGTLIADPAYSHVKLLTQHL